MADASRIDPVVDMLRMYWENHPDHRLGQIVGNVLMVLNRDTDPYHLSDMDFATGLSKLMRMEDEKAYDDEMRRRIAGLEGQERFDLEEVARQLGIDLDG